jgi:hypothetical protein
MDSQERHELKQNDLQEFLSHFKEWWDKHGTTILLALIVVILGFYGWRWYSTKDVKARQAAWSAVQLAATPEGLQDAAALHADVRGAWGRAMLDAADALASQANLGIEPSAAGQPGQEVTLTPEQRQRKRQLAADLYQRVIDQAEGLFAINARFGLAAINESMGEFDKAAAQYGEIQRQAASWPNIIRQAERQSARLQTLRQPIEFRAAPAPEPEADAAIEGDAPAEPEAPIGPPASTE